jgi:hypothetical protein
MNERVCSRGPTERGGGDRGARTEGGVHAGVPGQGTMTPAQEEKAAVYKELGYRPAGMVGKHLTARPMKTRKEVHGPGHGGGREDGDTLFRYR